MPSACHTLPKDGLNARFGSNGFLVVKEGATQQKYGTPQLKNTYNI